MTARPQPTKVFHFTHLEHLPSMLENGLLSDHVARSNGLLTVEVGDTGIKERRRHREVPLVPGSVVADYVPFYFAPRSPMMFSISRGNIATYQGGTARLIYVVTTLEVLDASQHAVVLTDRNAVLAYASFRGFDPHDPIDDDFIDWDLMQERIWRNTLTDGQRVERRMAEALVIERVAWEAVEAIATQNQQAASEVRAILNHAGLTAPVVVRPDWYF